MSQQEPVHVPTAQLPDKQTRPTEMQWQEAVEMAQRVLHAIQQQGLREQFRQLHDKLSRLTADIDPYENEKEYRRAQALRDLVRHWDQELERIIQNGAIAKSHLDTAAAKEREGQKTEGEPDPPPLVP